MPALSLITEKHRLASCLRMQGYTDEAITVDRMIVDKNEGRVLSDTEEVFRSWEKKIDGLILTDKRCMDFLDMKEL